MSFVYSGSLWSCALLWQGANREAPGKSGLHARGEGERVLALESREGHCYCTEIQLISVYLSCMLKLLNELVYWFSSFVVDL